MKSILFFAVTIMILCCTKPGQPFYMPAEWEPHDAVWLGWPKENLSGKYSTGNDTLFHPAILNLIKALIPHVLIKIAVRSDSLLHEAKKYLLLDQNLDPARIKFYLMPGDFYWMRDYGASFLINDAGELGVADFDWSMYGYPGFLKEKYNSQDSITKYIRLDINPQTGQIDSLMGVVENATIKKTNVVHEGGALEVNGKGTIILCEATVLQRNPGQTKERLEKEFEKVLGVTKIIWLKKGLADDPHWFYRRIVNNYVGGGTGGHTDEFVRFANPNTILLAWVNEEEKDKNPVNKINYIRMNENLKILEQSTDQDGKSFNIIKVPLPDLISKELISPGQIDKFISPLALDLKPDAFIPSEAPKEGDTLLRVAASSYLNYLVTNGIVILPTYTHMGSSKEKEEEVRKIFKRQFPGREIVFIDVMPQNWYGGGIHCSTQQQPSRRKIK
jgi:agmatine deiminase